MLSKFKTDVPEPRDQLIIVNDNGTADIARVIDQDHERIMGTSRTGEYAVPLADVKAYAGARGIIYLYPATHENIEDTQRLADLERSIVLRQITQYEKPDLDTKMDFKQVFLYIIIFVLIIVVAVK